MQNPLATYEAAVEALKTADEREALHHKHQAVLALVRAGSLDFALKEYDRYGLKDIRHHEDIIGLGGRLYKDLYLSHTGAEAKEFARQSADKYEQGYQDTRGYYSGINAATMSLLGGIPKEIVEMRAQRILDGLPDGQDSSDEEIYFIEATRAEAWLLLGNITAARGALRNALDYDPLNYTAHASTLKQFRMIAAAKGDDLPWLSEFVPPKAMHLAGHIFGREGDGKDFPVLTKSAEKGLAEEISNHIQENDIGFAYGALAAGADIMIAEAILEEGGELHVVLPAQKSLFIEKSVAPFGENWTQRFHDCLKNAHSVTCFEARDQWPDPMLQQQASLVCMGNAIRKSHELCVAAVQLLVWDSQKSGFGTAKDAAIWHATGRPQFTIAYPEPRNARPHNTNEGGYGFRATLQDASSKEAKVYSDLIDAVTAALSARSKTPDLAQTIGYDLIAKGEVGPKTKFETFKALPGAIHVDELAANYLAVYHAKDYQIDFIGLGESGKRIFVLRERGT